MYNFVQQSHTSLVGCIVLYSLHYQLYRYLRLIQQIKESGSAEPLRDPAVDCLNVILILILSFNFKFHVWIVKN